MNRNTLTVAAALIAAAGAWNAVPGAVMLVGTGLALTAVPALAQENDEGADNGSSGSDDRHGDDSERGDARDGEDRGQDNGSGLDADDRADEGLEFEPDVVLAIDLTRPARIRARAMGFRLISEERLLGLGFRLAELSVPGGIPTREALADLRRADPAGRYDLNLRYRTAGAEDACAGVRCQGQRAVGWPPAGCAADATIGMVDTAVALDSPALAGRRIQQVHFGNSGISAAGTAHGTEIATQLVGNVAAGQAGLLPQALLLSADVFDYHDGRGVSTNALQLARGFDWLAARHPAVINVAIAGPDNGVLQETVQRTVGAGIAVVAAAGNLGPAGPARYPAAYPEAIAVTAVDRYRAVYAQANQGAYIALAAPGVDIWTAAADGRGRFVEGTSFATPFVSSAVALLKRADPAATPAGLAQALRRNAIDLGAPGPDPVFGAGLLQAPPCPAASGAPPG